MDATTERTIFFVDDEPGVCKAVSQTLEQLENCRVHCFQNAGSCLKALQKTDCNLLITDVSMPGMDGLGLQEQVRRLYPQLGVLLITGYGDVTMAVRAIKAGAIDFIEKPLNEESFLPVVEAALRRSLSEDMLRAKTLTKSEKKILKQIAEGKSNKEIAFALRRSVRTIENHRHRLMQKLGVKNAAELVKKAINIGLAPCE